MATEEITEEQKAIADSTKALDDAANAQQEQMKKLQDQADAKSLADQANQKMAEAMYQIEDTLIDTRKKLDAILGKSLDPRLDPDTIDFDFNYSMGDINKMLSPLMAVTSPLASVCGPVPVVGQLPTMMANIQEATIKADEVDPAKIKEMVPEPPEVSPVVKSEIGKILADIQALCTKLPMMLINLIFQMINVIYSKLKIITSVIPLGSFFPLNLIGSAITAEPTIEDFVTQAPAKVKDMAMGAAKKVAAAQTTLAVPTAPTAIPISIDVSQSTNSSESNKVADVDTNAPTTQQISSPIQSSIPEIQATPPIQVPLKSLDQLEAEWEPEYKKLKLYVFESRPEKSYSGTDFLQYVPRLKLDDEWTHIKKCVELWSLKNEEKARYMFKEIYRCITNQSSLGYQLQIMDDYRGKDLVEESGKTLAKLNIDGMSGRYLGSIGICTQGYIDDFRLKPNDDEVNDHIELLKEDSRYSTKPKYKDQLDQGIAKYPKFLDKYFFFKRDSLPGFASTMIIGRNQMKNLDK